MTKFLLGIIAVLAVAMVGGYLYFQGQIDDVGQDVRGVHNVIEKLQPGEESKISVEDQVLTYLERYAPDSVYVKQQYVPPESGVEVIVQKDTVAMQELEDVYLELVRLRESGEVSQEVLDSLERELDSIASNIYNTEVHVDRSGFCMEPEVGVCVSDEGNIGVSGGARVYYRDRFGIGVEGNVYKPDQLFTEASESEFALGGFVDGRIPGLDNVSGKLGIGRNFTDSDWQFNIGFNFYLE